jgi:ABC-type branched-subunit amino acid transport system substrate-binding protein
MRRLVPLVLALVATGAIAGGVRPLAAGAGATKPVATEVGVSAHTIRIALIADVDTPLSPGLFQSSVDSVRGAVKMINADGGVAGRQLQVDFIDSKLNANASRNALITACSQDLALVGTSSIFMTNVTDAIQCTDRAGKPTGLPDVGGVVPGVAQQCAPTSFPVNAPQLRCATRDQHPQTYAGNQGGSRYLVRREKHRLHGVLVKSADAVNPSNDVLDAIIQHAGVNADDVVSLSAIAPQSAYTPVIQTMTQSSANFASTGLAAASMISLRQEARIQGLDDPATVWLCTAACYERSFLDAGEAVEGTYVPIGFLPFDETTASRAVAEYVRAVGRDKVSGLGVYAYAATLALREVLERIVRTHGVNGITRAAVLDGLQDLTDFDAGGLVGRTDIAGKQVTSCFVLTQVRGGRFVRVHPKKPATFDCTPSNRVNVEGDFIK